MFLIGGTKTYGANILNTATGKRGDSWATPVVNGFKFFLNVVNYVCILSIFWTLCSHDNPKI